MPKTKTGIFRITPETVAKLAELSDLWSCSKTAVVERLIDEAFGSPAPAPAPAPASPSPASPSPAPASPSPASPAPAPAPVPAPAPMPWSITKRRETPSKGYSCALCDDGRQRLTRQCLHTYLESDPFFSRDGHGE